MNNTKVILTLILLITCSVCTQAANLIKFEIVNENTLMLLFNNGDIIHLDQLGQNNDNDDSSNLNPLNICAAENRTNYLLISADDAAYDKNEIPTNIGLFTKGKYFSGKQTKEFPISYNHQFLVLPYALKQNKTYKIIISNILNTSLISNFQFNPFTHHSEVVHTNQIA